MLKSIGTKALFLGLVQLAQIASGEIVFLSNCFKGSNVVHSEMDYYTNNPPSGQAPKSKTGHLNGNAALVWEGDKRCGKFSDTEFCSYVDKPGHAKGEYVGSGSNGYGTNFDCYAEGGYRYLYTDSSGNKCWAVYYCSTK